MTIRNVLGPLVVGSLLFVNVASAMEQKIVFTVDSFKLRGSKATVEKCARACRVKYGDGKLEPLLADGWKIVSSTAKEAVCMEDWAVFPGDPLVQGCSGVGTQYVVQKDDPAPVAKVETSNKEVELLKKENDLLKQEIALLKQENENLKNQIKTKQKKK
jgi:hypothetical protein